MVTVFCCTAPFIHILLDKKSPQFDLLDAQLESKELTQANYEAAVEQLKESEKYFGFTNKRKFWYAIGKPIAMTYVSFMLLFLSGYVNDPKVSGIANISGILFFSISMYFVVWTFWDRQDFPATAYFVSIGVISIASTFLALKYLKQKYEEEYFEAGLVLGFSTHSRRNAEYRMRNQWLLVGLIRLDQTDQAQLF